MGKIYTPEERREIINKVDQLVAEGTTKNEAMKRVGCNSYSYHHWKIALSPKKRKKRLQPTITTVELPQGTFETGRLFALVGAPKAVLEAIRGLT